MTFTPSGGALPPSPGEDLARREVWASLRPGDRLGPIVWAVDASARAQRQAAVGPCAGPYAPGRAGADVLLPVFFQDAYYALMDLRYAWPLAIAAKLEILSYAPAPAAAAYACELEIEGTYERRAGRYVVTRTTAQDHAGRLVCALRNTALTNPIDVLRP